MQVMHGSDPRATRTACASIRDTVGSCMLQCCIHHAAPEQDHQDHNRAKACCSILHQRAIRIRIRLRIVPPTCIRTGHEPVPSDHCTFQPHSPCSSTTLLLLAQVSININKLVCQRIQLHAQAGRLSRRAHCRPWLHWRDSRHRQCQQCGTASASSATLPV